ncbi:lysylphosphatidylglycerol synthase domain-containing protein [Acetobacteraceae bacterium KSS8]|uniref:Lysylphosphatidylglycerol synthase domain-containing protein n=1 Tax=Endosaccharibacter trunci TaxID=2812733 RepID=A0ABT1W541_9PROT|nr:lysylphosphatidylglycerol synthase domain-containing protein [Acetobacteraceae bacterium KSS8]
MRSDLDRKSVLAPDGMPLGDGGGASLPDCRPEPDGAPSRLKRLLGLLPPMLGLFLLVGAIYAVHNEFRHLSPGRIRATLGEIPSRALLLSAGFTLLSYFVLSFYDRLAVLHVGRRLSFGRTAFAAFCSYVLSHNLGFAAISGAAVRFRLYGSWGLKPLEITRIIAFCSVTYLLGACALVGGVLLLEPSALSALNAHLPRGAMAFVGVAAWAVVFAYVGLSARFPSVRLWRWTVPLPGVAMAIGQVVVSALDVAATAAIAYALLPAGIGLSYPAFLAIYIACYSAGLLASVPGGLGVFDGAMVLGLSPFVSAADAVATILVFRLYYYILPLFLAGLLFAGHELFLRGDSLLAARTGVERAAPPRPSLAVRETEADFSVTAATGAVILCGAMLIATGMFHRAPDDLTLLIPTLGPAGPDGLLGGDPVGAFTRGIEAVGDYVLSLIGAVLIGLAIGLSQRVTLAWGATLVCLSTAAALAALRGLPLEIPAVLILAALAIAPFRSSYYRHARVLSEPLAPATMVPLLLLVVSLLILSRLEPGVSATGARGWLPLILANHVPTHRRVSTALAVLVGLVALGRLVRPGHVSALPFSGEPGARWLQLAVEAGGSLDARGVDGLMAGETGRALIAFRRERGVLIGLGDPLGAPADRVSAIWRLRDLALEEQRAPVFWRVGPELLPVYADLGLVSWPLDETNTSFLCCAAERGEQLLARFERLSQT